jgi:hypothetical protein
MSRTSDMGPGTARAVNRAPVPPIVELVPAGLAMATEGAWVAVLYALVEAAASGPFLLGPVGMIVAAAIGLAAARLGAARLGERWPTVALVLVLGAATAGWLADPVVRSFLVEGAPERATFTHPGGWLAGLALLRGIAHARPSTSGAALERLMLVGLPALAIPLLVGGMLAAPRWELFVAEATPAILLFAVAGTVGLAVRRLDRVGIGAGFDWRRNRAWLLMVALLVVGAGILAIPVSGVVGPAVRIAVGVLVVPLLLVGAIAGFSSVSRRAVLSLVVMAVVMAIVIVVAGTSDQPTPDPPDPVGGAGGGTAGDVIITVGLGGLLTVLVVVGILILARLWMREALQPGVSDVREERVIDPGDREPVARAPSTGGRRRRIEPTDAVSAYLALIDDLDPRPTVRRSVGETPSEHARRLRTAGTGATSLDLLAADYALARFGERRLSPREEGRGVARWRRLRSVLGR